MRLAWFTPFGRTSAIGEYSEHVTAQLARTLDVELWTDDAVDPRQTSLQRHRAVDAVEWPEVLDRYDLAVYNFGDHSGYHGAIATLANSHAGVVVLHDRSYQNLYASIWDATKPGARRYLDRLASLYGPAVASKAAAELAQGVQPWESPDFAARYPLVEEPLVRALAAVTHARDHAKDVRRRWGGVVEALFLPSYPTDPAETPPISNKDGRLVVLTVGYVNPNKQIDRVLRALAEDSKLARRVRYLVLGPYEASSRSFRALARLASELDLGDSVEFLGYQPDDVLFAYMREADIFVNLRYPNLEGGSASMMRQLAFGRPVVAYDSGIFADVADDGIVRVAPFDDAALRAALSRLVDDEQLRRRVGEAGRVWATDHSVSRYAEQFIAFATAVRRKSPAIRLADRVAHELLEMRVDPTLASIDRIAHQLALADEHDA
jgi:glycosyltransferase involved in cell wall biosynthesis